MYQKEKKRALPPLTYPLNNFFYNFLTVFEPYHAPVKLYSWIKDLMVVDEFRWVGERRIGCRDRGRNGKAYFSSRFIFCFKFKHMRELIRQQLIQQVFSVSVFRVDYTLYSNYHLLDYYCSDYGKRATTAQPITL